MSLGKDEILQNIQLFNLVDKKVSYHFVKNLLKAYGDNVVTIDYLKHYLAVNHIEDSVVVEKFQNLDRSYFSLYCLIYFDVDVFTIERLSEHFNKLNNMMNNVSKLNDLSIRDDVILKIRRALDFIFDKYEALQSSKLILIKEEIVEMIRTEQPIGVGVLKRYVFEKYPKITTEEYESIINSIISSRLVYLTFDGFKTKEDDILKYLENSGRNVDKVILKVINGYPVGTFLKNYKISLHDMNIIIRKGIKTLPLFDGETFLYFVLSTYDISEADAYDLGFSSPVYRYVKLKYPKLSPSKDVVDYICDKNLVSKKGVKEVLKRHDLILIDSQIFDQNFNDIFYYFLEKNNVISFSLEDITSHFNNFLSKYDVDSKKIYISDPRRKLDCLKNDDRFIYVRKMQFVVDKEETYSYEFLYEIQQYLSTFVGYGSVSYFFNRHRTLCEKSGLDDIFKLFAFMNKKYQGLNIDFIGAPYICEKDVDPREYLESLLLDLELPCTKDEYSKHVENVTGIDKANFEKTYKGIFEKYLNSSNMLSLTEDLSEDEITKLVEYLDGKEAAGTKYLRTQFEIMFKERASICLNANILRKLGFIKTDTCIYRDIYSSRGQAVKAELLKQSPIIEKSTLQHISNLEFFFYRSCDGFDESLVVNIGKDKYLNLVKRNQSLLVCYFKKDLVSILSENEYYVLNSFLESSDFESLLRKNEEYSSLVYAFDTYSIMKDIIKTTRELETVDSNLGLVFCKGELSLKLIIKKIVEEYNSLSILELQEILIDQYGIDKTIYNRELSEMGFYCPKTSEKVYLNVDYYNLEMEELLDGNS